MRALPIILALSCSACAEKTAQLDLPAPEMRSPVALKTPKLGRLLVSWRPLEDLRPDPHSIGGIGPTAYFSQSVVSWLNGEFQAISGKKFAATADLATADIVITPCLQKLYLEGLDVNKTAVIVIELNFSYRHGNSVKRIFRGLYTGMNWASSDDEMVLALQRAFVDCRSKIILALETEAQKATASHI